MNTTADQSITLYYREGPSDKVYQCAIEPAGERFVVNLAYEKRRVLDKYFQNCQINCSRDAEVLNGCQVVWCCRQA